MLKIKYKMSGQCRGSKHGTTAQPQHARTSAAKLKSQFFYCETLVIIFFTRHQCHNAEMLVFECHDAGTSTRQTRSIVSRHWDAVPQRCYAKHFS